MNRFARVGFFLLLALVLLLLLIPIGMRIMTSLFIHTNLSDVQKADVAIIPGASVMGKTLSPVLESRAEAAALLYEAGKVSQILVTGDRSAFYDEVTPVQTYLVSRGIPESDIILDKEGFDTYSSMYRAKNVYNVVSAIVVTQDFHLPRAVFLARALGINAYGFTASGAGSAEEYLREIPASIKALWDLLTHRIPRSS